MPVDLPLWLKVGSSLTALITKLHNTDTVFEPAPLTKRIANILHAPTGAQAITARVQSRLKPWLDTLPDDGLLEGDVAAAFDAAAATLVDTSTMARLAVNIYARREDVEAQLQETGRKHHEALGNERAQLIYKRTLDACVAVINEMAPKSKSFAIDASAIILQELESEKEQLQAIHEDDAAAHGITHRRIALISSQMADLAAAMQQYHRQRDNPRNPDAVITAVSDPRFLTYLTRVGGDPSRALGLYDWNLQTSAAFYTGLAIVEVALRNAMDPQIGLFNAAQTDLPANIENPTAWLLHPSRLLVKLTTPPNRPSGCTVKGCPMRSSLYLAQDRAHFAVGARRTPNHNDVLAQVSFGTWGHLLPTSTAKQAGKGRAHLWRGYLEQAFPYLEHDPTQLTLHVNGLRAVRNRIAHLEHLLDRHQLRVNLDSMQLVLEAINPSLTEWLPISEIERCISSRPQLDPATQTQTPSGAPPSAEPALSHDLD